MEQRQTIDFTTPNPGAKANFSLSESEGCSYNETYNCWSIDFVGGHFWFNLNLPRDRGVNLSFQLCSAAVDGVSNCPISLFVNRHTVVSNWDPHVSTFYDQAWYIPDSQLDPGDNEIILQLAGGTTKVFLRYVTAAMYEMQRQEQTNWCWSAVTTSTSIYYDPNSDWTQCELANAVLNQTTCCQDGSECNKPFQLNKALELSENLDHHARGAQRLDTVQDEANAARPLAACIAWGGGGFHFVVLAGVGVNGMVAVEDPWDGSSYIAYDQLQNRYKGRGKWAWSYFTKAQTRKEER